MNRIIGILLCAFFALFTQAAAADDFSRPYHVNYPREVLLDAWERLKAVEIPGVPVDMRFDIDGQTFYVCPTGDDEDEGTIDAPWRTLAHAVKRLEPNTVIYLREGEYYGPVTISIRATKDAPAALRAMAGEKVTITYRPEWVKERQEALVPVPEHLDARRFRAVTEESLANNRSDHYPPLINIRGHYIEISGLHLIGARAELPHNLFTECGILMTGGGGEGVRILYNEIEQVGHCGVKEQGHGGHSFLVEGNFIHSLGHTGHDHGVYMSTPDVVIRKNLILNTASYGVHGYTRPPRAIISHNIIGGNFAYGIVMGGADSRIAHNILYRNRSGGVFLFRGGSRNNIVVNNIAIGQPLAGFDNLGGTRGPEANPRDNILDHNLILPGGTIGNLGPEDEPGENNIVADPLFVNAEELDFRLRAESPCVDAGAEGAGAWRGAAPNIGLYETEEGELQGEPLEVPEPIRSK